MKKAIPVAGGGISANDSVTLGSQKTLNQFNVRQNLVVIFKVHKTGSASGIFSSVVGVLMSQMNPGRKMHGSTAFVCYSKQISLECNSVKRGIWVVFDLDGTLNRADLIAVEANRQAQKEFNLPISEPEVIISAVGEKSDDYLDYLAPGLNREQRDRYIARVIEFEGYYGKQHGSFYEGSDRLLQELRAEGYHIAI